MSSNIIPWENTLRDDVVSEATRQLIHQSGGSELYQAAEALLNTIDKNSGINIQNLNTAALQDKLRRAPEVMYVNFNIFYFTLVTEGFNMSGNIIQV
jgi:hypothetical protein